MMKNIFWLLCFAAVVVFTGCSDRKPRPDFAVRVVLDIPDMKNGISINLSHKELHGKENIESLIVSKKIGMDGRNIVGAYAGEDVFGMPVVTVILNDAGKKEFYELTKENVGRRVVLFVNDKPLCAPRIMEAINSGSLQISGVSAGEAADIASGFGSTLSSREMFERARGMIFSICYHVRAWFSAFLASPVETAPETSRE